MANKPSIAPKPPKHSATWAQNRMAESQGKKPKRQMKATQKYRPGGK